MFNIIKSFFTCGWFKPFYPRGFERVRGNEVVYGVFEIRKVNYYGLCGIAIERVVLPLNRIIYDDCRGVFVNTSIPYPDDYKLLFVQNEQGES